MTAGHYCPGQNSARSRREAMQQVASLRRRLDAAEDALAEAAVTMKRAETAFDAANDRFAAAEEVLDQARAERDRARRERYAARQAHERASVTAARLQRRLREVADRLDQMREKEPPP